MQDKLKEAFAKIKQDILSLRREILILKEQLSTINTFIDTYFKKEICSAHSRLESNRLEDPTDLNAQKLGDLSLNFHFSTGNEGVPTDRQTNRQTTNRQQTDNLERTFSGSAFQNKSSLINDLKSFQKKFQELTKQEFLIFSIIYILSSERKITYRDIALKAKLSESSVRDYVSRLIKKGIPLAREKLNNKQIVLEVPREFKEVAPLDVLTRLRNEEF